MKTTRRRAGVAILSANLLVGLIMTTLGAGPGATAAPQDPFQDRVDQFAKELADLSQARAADETAQSEPGATELAKPGMSVPEARVRMFSAFGAPAPYSLTGPITPGGEYLGSGYQWHNPLSSHPHWLGGFILDGHNQWCIDFTAITPSGAGRTGTAHLVSPRGLAGADPYLLESNQQMGFIMDKYGKQLDAGILAATSVVAHMNYELAGGRDFLPPLIDSLSNSVDGRAVAGMAQTMVADARQNAPAFEAAKARFVVAEGAQTFQLDNLGLLSQTGSWVSGKRMTVTLTGAGVFDKTNAQGGSFNAAGTVWTGKTSNGPLSLSGVSVANGKVHAQVSFESIEVPASVATVERDNGTQTTIRVHPGTVVVGSFTPPPGDLLYDFQPVLESSTKGAQSRFLTEEDTVLRDSLKVEADPNYSNPQWLGVGRTKPGQDGYQPLPVLFTGTAYRTGMKPAAESSTIPVDAEVVATAELVAKGPGTYTVEAAFESEPGFVVWVWEVDPSNQPQIAPADRHMIAGPWADNYGVADEYTSVYWEGKVESNLTVKPTIDNTYLVDDVWISGLPEDHPDFLGSHGFTADRKTIEQDLYFWEEGTPVESLDDAIQVGDTLTIPARNGMYLGQGGLSWKLLRDEQGRPLRGTYQVVHSFVGDDRVEPFVSAIPDVTEQFTVTGNPQIGTTATGPENKKVIPASKEVRVIDEACYLDLTPGKEYRLEGTLMNAKTGEPIEQGGKPVTAQTTFIPEERDGCEEVQFTFDSSALHSMSLVVFEELWQEDTLVAVHADLHDRGQTVTVSEKPTEPGELAKTGLGGLLPALLGAVGLGAGATLLAATRKLSR